LSRAKNHFDNSVPFAKTFSLKLQQFK